MQQVTTSPIPIPISREGESEGGRRSTVTGWIGFIVIIAAIAAPIVLQRYATFDPGIMLTFGYAAVFVMGALGSVTFFLPVPVLTLVFAGATILNPVLLAVAAAAGITLGMAGCYALGKAGSKMAERSQPEPGTRLHRATARVTTWYSSNVTTASFFVAAVPNPVFDYAGYFAGLVGVDQKRFLVATFGGKFVQSLVVALLGYYAFEQISRAW
jgi:membrane protein DedA with SNARE-associated domain